MVKAKKHLGQHFLKDESISQRIAESIKSDYDKLIEIGPGTGVLTKYLDKSKSFTAIEIDKESYDYLIDNAYLDETQIIYGDFLRLDSKDLFTKKTAIVGNFPYNISSQIVFKIFENRDSIIEMVGMFQKEVAERIASENGNRSYGILSVLIQAYYDVEYLFTVNEDVFIPPPKVKSGVIRLTRNSVDKLGCDEAKFVSIVKQSFGQRRKMIRKSLKSHIKDDSLLETDLFKSRPEELSVKQFVELTNILFPNTWETKNTE